MNVTVFYFLCNTLQWLSSSMTGQLKIIIVIHRAPSSLFLINFPTLFGVTIFFILLHPQMFSSCSISWFLFRMFPCYRHQPNYNLDKAQKIPNPTAGQCIFLCSLWWTYHILECFLFSCYLDSYLYDFCFISLYKFGEFLL